MNNLQPIADNLAARGLRVTVEFPGCIVIWAEDLAHPHLAWWFGTANATWQGDLNDEGGHYLGDTCDTGVPSTESDPTIVADAIVRALEQDPR